MTDEELVIKASEGDSESFEAIVNKYERLVYSICYRMFNNKEDSLDCTQDTFIKVYKNMEKAIGNGNFKSWICRVATNTCLDELRKRGKKNETSLFTLSNENNESLEKEIVDTSATPLEEILENEKSLVLENAINKLNDENKTVIVLRDIEQLPYEEIAQILGISLGTVKSRISRARKKLKDIYLKDMEQFKK